MCLLNHLVLSCIFFYSILHPGTQPNLGSNIYLILAWQMNSCIVKSTKACIARYIGHTACYYGIVLCTNSPFIFSAWEIKSIGVLTIHYWVKKQEAQTFLSSSNSLLEHHFEKHLSVFTTVMSIRLESRFMHKLYTTSRPSESVTSMLPGDLDHPASCSRSAHAIP